MGASPKQWYCYGIAFVASSAHSENTDLGQTTVLSQNTAGPSLQELRSPNADLPCISLVTWHVPGTFCVSPGTHILVIFASIVAEFMQIPFRYNVIKVGIR